MPSAAIATNNATLSMSMFCADKRQPGTPLGFESTPRICQPRFRIRASPHTLTGFFQGKQVKTGSCKMFEKARKPARQDCSKYVSCFVRLQRSRAHLGRRRKRKSLVGKRRQAKVRYSGPATRINTGCSWFCASLLRAD